MNKMLLSACLSLATLPLVAEMKVLAFAGSSRTDSFNKKLVHEAAAMASQMGAKVTIIDLNDYPMPFYNGDIELKEGMPKNAERFRELMINSDAIIIASPEYNASIPAVLKNALDWASRGKEGGSSREAFKGKLFALMSASPGKSGGGRGLAHLRTIIEDIGGNVIPQQTTIPKAHEYFSKEERPENLLLKAELQQLLSPIPTAV